MKKATKTNNNINKINDEDIEKMCMGILRCLNYFEKYKMPMKQKGTGNEKE